MHQIPTKKEKQPLTLPFFGSYVDLGLHGNSLVSWGLCAESQSSRMGRIASLAFLHWTYESTKVSLD